MKNKENLNEKLKITLTECPKSLDFSTDISEELKEPPIYLDLPEGHFGHQSVTTIVKIIK